MTVATATNSGDNGSGAISGVPERHSWQRKINVSGSGNRGAAAEVMVETENGYC